MLRPSASQPASEPPSRLAILILDGNPPEVREDDKKWFGMSVGQAYANVLSEIDSSIQTEIIFAGDVQRTNPLEKRFDLAIMTGSSLHVYEEQSQVRRQVEIVRELVMSGVPYFGSCWGMQVAASSFGGSVRRSSTPETLVANKIALTQFGKVHDLFSGKAHQFDALAHHQDEIEKLPPNTQTLASNAKCKHQAIAIGGLPAPVLGVQYHPEFRPQHVAKFAAGNRTEILESMLFKTDSEVDEVISCLASSQVLPDWFGETDDILSSERHQQELSNVLKIARRHQSARSLT